MNRCYKKVNGKENRGDKVSEVMHILCGILFFWSSLMGFFSALKKWVEFWSQCSTRSLDQHQVWERLVSSHGLDCVQEQDTTVVTSGGKSSGSTNKMAISIWRTLFPKFHPLKEVQVGCQTQYKTHTQWGINSIFLFLQFLQLCYFVESLQ